LWDEISPIFLEHLINGQDILNLAYLIMNFSLKLELMEKIFQIGLRTTIQSGSNMD
jgi:hypothetical protein